MSLSSSLFTGTSGLKNMGNALQVVGNNISNLNTIGFKKGRSTFADTLYESISTQAGTDQIGRGMAIGTVSQNFAQGSFESTGNATDLSIGGNGFFVLRQANTENKFYTRAGNFFFNKTGELVNPEGYIVQGWKLDDETGQDIGSIQDLVLSQFTSPPKKSTEVNVVANLNADKESNSVVLSNVFNSSKSPAISAGNYEYQTVVKVYDSLGSTHDINIIYDKKSGTDWEYVVTMNPDEDKRNLVQGTNSQGLLARGTISFSKSSGAITDFTMSKMTGRMGNFKANGVNTVKDVNYQITDYEAVSLDGYGFSLEYDGSAWNFTDKNNDGIISAADLPDNYGNAKIVLSDSQNVHIVLDPKSNADTEPDLKIKLGHPAVATDSIGFDINNKNDLHTQGISGTTYTGDTANDKTTMQINEPGVMTVDSENLGIIWNPKTETWHWSNPSAAKDKGTLVASVETNDTAAIATTSTNIVVHNAADLNMVSNGMKVRYDARTGDWDWNQPLKTDDFKNTVFNFTPTNNPVLSVISSGDQGAMASADTAGNAATITLTWEGGTAGGSPTGWVASAGGGTTQFAFDTANSDNSQVQLLVWEGAGNSAGASTIRYSFGSDLTTTGNQTIAFNIDPTPPSEYPNAQITTAAATATGIALDLDSDNTVDIEFNVTAGSATTVGDGDYLSFNLNPDAPPAEYANATLRGDKDKAIIDLDGSGNESDNEDIVFNFKSSLRAGTSTHPYEDRSAINFNIKGSTAWTEVSKESIQQDGYYSFTADFLGGEFGATENNLKLDIGTKYDGNNFINDSMTTTQFSKASATVFQDADGYAAGDLERVSVASDGIITGVYSNGQLIPLFRVGLAKFQNNFGLSNAGGNLFTETRDSGSAITNKPGENGLGKISPNSLEMSNVDISDEFVKMITNQRGFQANSKTVTTVDAMMQTVIQMKQ